MAIKQGRLEAQITVPTGGWDVEVATPAPTSDSGTATIPAGTYYLTGLAAEVATQVTAVLSTGSATCTVSDGETSATGKCTIAIAGQAEISLTWTDTDLRDALGFTGDVSGAASHTGANHCKGLWLPTCAKWTPYGDEDAGHEEADIRRTESPAGHIHTIYGQRKTVLAGLRWDAISHARARIAGESVTGESFQQFFRDCILGELSYVEPGAPIRLYWDADVDGTYATYRIGGDSLRMFAPAQFLPDLTALWRIEFERLVEVP